MATDPQTVLDLLALLSTDVRAAAVLSPDGVPRAGDPALAARARDLAPGRHGDVLVARTPDGGALAVAVGPHVLEPLARHDLEALAARL